MINTKKKKKKPTQPIFFNSLIRKTDIYIEHGRRRKKTEADTPRQMTIWMFIDTVSRHPTKQQVLHINRHRERRKREREYMCVCEIVLRSSLKLLERRKAKALLSCRKAKAIFARDPIRRIWMNDGRIWKRIVVLMFWLVMKDLTMIEKNSIENFSMVHLLLLLLVGRIQ